MSKRNGSQISVAVVKNGKDICRIIFTRADKERYDIKIDFFGNRFQVQSYRLFSYRPIVWNIAELENNISYHHGKDNKPVVIHIKHERKVPGKNQYTTLPLARIMPPNNTQTFPLPLLKIEIPDIIIENAKPYKKKTYHHTIDIENSNVVELFMLPEDGVHEVFGDKYPYISNVYMIAPIDFFASNTVLSDYQKFGNFIPSGEPDLRGLGISGLNGMNLYASFFPDPNLNCRCDKLVFTFIENQLAEAILLNAIIRTNDNKNWFGGASYKQLDFPNDTESITPIQNSVADWTIGVASLSRSEKENIYKKAVTGRRILRDEMKKYEYTLLIEKEELKNSIENFMGSLSQLQQECIKCHVPHFSENDYRVTDEDIWLMTSFLCHSEDVHILFARYMNNNNFSLVRRFIRHKEFRPSPPAETKYGSDGSEIKVFRPISILENEFNHTWLEYNDHFDVDLLRGSLNLFLGNDGKEPEYIIERAYLTSNNDNWKGMKERLEKNDFICSNVEKRFVTKDLVDMYMSRNNSLLDRIYKRITKKKIY